MAIYIKITEIWTYVALELLKFEFYVTLKLSLSGAWVKLKLFTFEACCVI